MTAEQSYLVRKTWAVLERHREVTALTFYQRLFTAHPMLRPLFSPDIEEQARKFTLMLGMLISLLERPGEMQGTLLRLGERHAGYGVRDCHYTPVGAVLIETLQEVLGAEFTPDTRAAWTALYAAVAQAMQAGAAQAGEKALK
ncbi:MAG: hypothetical protein JWM59_3935 [Verrucomicrobiales bacterium]|nr:hypothetical protein [Verrucomicrobiales bacterium]